MKNLLGGKGANLAVAWATNQFFPCFAKLMPEGLKRVNLRELIRH